MKTARAIVWRIFEAWSVPIRPLVVFSPLHGEYRASVHIPMSTLVSSITFSAGCISNGDADYLRKNILFSLRDTRSGFVWFVIPELAVDTRLEDALAEYVAIVSALLDTALESC